MPRTTAKAGTGLFMCRNSFAAKVDGVDATFIAGKTIVREGHDILRRFGENFEPLRVTYDIEQATDEPGELRNR